MSKDHEATGMSDMTMSKQIQVDQDGLCQRCAAIPWDEMAFAIEAHLPFLRRIPIVDIDTHEIYDLNTTIDETAESLRLSPCYFCQLLAKALAIHGQLSPGRLECVVHENSSMAQIRMYSRVSAFAVSLNDKVETERQFRAEYKNIQEMDYESLRADLQTCEQAHPGCIPDTLSNLPGLKFIDCETRRVGAPSKTNTKLHYVVLSYVWGSKPDESRVDARGTLEDLKRTISDSILLCQVLGYKYLWVDRYCIDQRNEKEKAIQIANMGRIYSSAQFTIIASVGQDPEYGLPGITADVEKIPFLCERIKRLTIAVRPVTLSASIAASKWASRGWTYQECYLSRKRVFFTNTGVYYVCNTSRPRSLSLLTSILPVPQNAQSPLKPPVRLRNPVVIWTFRLASLTMNLEAYSERQLSYDADALDAISGALSTQITNKLPVHHLWGVPIFETDIAFNLSSSPNQFKEKIQPGETMSIEFSLLWQHFRPRRRRKDFPSWSFLGWAGRMKLRHWPSQVHLGQYCTIHNLRRADDEVHRGDAQLALETAPVPKFHLLPQGTHCLDMTINTLPLELVHVTWSDQGSYKEYSSNGYHVAISIQNGKESFCPVLWSRDPTEITPDTLLLAALFISERRIEKGGFAVPVFVLEELGDHYERIGICSFSGHEIRITKTDQRKGANVHVSEWEEQGMSMREWKNMSIVRRIMIG